MSWEWDSDPNLEPNSSSSSTSEASHLALSQDPLTLLVQAIPKEPPHIFSLSSN